jgi:hypothetical protein
MQGFLSIASFVPAGIADSYMEQRRRCERRWLARWGSMHNSAAKKMRRSRLRRLIFRSFALRRDLNRPSQPALSDRL